MPDADPLLGARLKIERARHHLKCLADQTRIFWETKPYRVAFERDTERPGDYVLRAYHRRGPVHIPARLSLIAGDVAHNLRCALDHLAWQLAEPGNAAGGTGPGNYTQFPIFDNEDGYGSNKERHLHGIDQRHWARIEGLQPYHVRKLIGTVDDIPAGHPLAPNLSLLKISRLDNVDKHRVLLARSGVYTFAVPVLQGVLQAKWSYDSAWVGVDDGAVLMRVSDVVLAPGHTEVEMKSPPSVSILFGDLEFDSYALWADRTKIGAGIADLNMAVTDVQAIIDEFSGAFARPPHRAPPG